MEEGNLSRYTFLSMRILNCVLSIQKKNKTIKNQLSILSKRSHGVLVTGEGPVEELYDDSRPR